MLEHRRRSLKLLAGVGAVWAARPALAHPDQPAKLVVGAAPGGPSDFLARVFAQAMAPGLRHGLVVENQPGASGTLAAHAVARSRPDGRTLLVSGPAAVVVAPRLQSNLGYDATSLAPVAMLGAGALLLVIHPSVPTRSVEELVALLRARAGALSFGSGGAGSSAHLCTELFSRSAAIGRVLHVPYRGDSLAMNDLLGGQIQMMFTAPNVIAAHVKAGRLRALAVTSRERQPSMPEVPSLHEVGFKDFEYLGWVMAFVPAATPPTGIEAMALRWQEASSHPSVKARLEGLGMSAPERFAGAAALRSFLESEDARLGKVIREADIKSD